MRQLADIIPPCTAAPDWWFSDDQYQIKVAKQTCNDCPLLAPCRQYAIDREEKYGIYGGLTAAERDRLRRRAAAA